jgi:hypothetical protein
LHAILAKRPNGFLVNLILDASKHFLAMDANFLRRMDAQSHNPAADIHYR